MKIRQCSFVTVWKTIALATIALGTLATQVVAASTAAGSGGKVVVASGGNCNAACALNITRGVGEAGVNLLL